jgi:membrane protein
MKVSEYNHKLLSLLIARLVIRNFSEGASPLTTPGIANTLGMPLRLVRGILSEFATSGLFTMTKTGEYEEDAYQPARDIHKISIRNVLDTLEKSGSTDLAFSRTEDFRAVSETLQTFGDTLEKSSANKLVIDM